jgi:hypothetical protein
MNKCSHLSAVLVGILAIHSAAQAQSDQIYTWTDENGVKHFVDNAADHPNAVSQEIRAGSSSSTTSEVSSNGQDASAVINVEDEEQEQLSPGQIKRQQLAEKRNLRRDEQANRDQNCTMARAQLASVEPSRRVFYTNEAGETVRLDDEERVKEVEKQKSIIAENCN